MRFSYGTTIHKSAKSLVNHVPCAWKQAISMREYTTALTGGLGCEEQRRLMENFAAVVKELVPLRHQQFEAAVHGDSDCTRFDLLIHMANERKQEAKYAYLLHVEWKSMAAIDVT